jgi:hypothetical protein
MVFELLHLLLEILGRDFGIGSSHFIDDAVPAEDQNLGGLIDNWFRHLWGGRRSSRRSARRRFGGRFSGKDRLANGERENERKSSKSSQHNRGKRL